MRAGVPGSGHTPHPGCSVAAAGRGRAGELETSGLVTVVLGQDAKLPCFYRGGPGEQVEQVSWARVDAGEGARELALLHSKYGLHVGTTYEGRVERPPPPRSPLDGAVLLRNAVQADEGEYECRVNTFPAGSFQARLRLRVLGKQRLRPGAAGGREGTGGAAPARGPAARKFSRSLGPRPRVGSCFLPFTDVSFLVCLALWGHVAQDYSLCPALSPLLPETASAPPLAVPTLAPHLACLSRSARTPIPARLTHKASHTTQTLSDCPAAAFQITEALPTAHPALLSSKLNSLGFTTVLPKTLVPGRPGHLGPVGLTPFLIWTCSECGWRPQLPFKPPCCTVGTCGPQMPYTCAQGHSRPFSLLGLLMS